MPLPGSIRSALASVPALDDSSYPPSLDQSSANSVDLSYSQFVFDKNADEIGRGGNATVYRATVRDSDLTVALKRPFPGRTVREETVEQILSEADKWEHVDGHPYIATVLDWGYEALPWIAIEYLDGGPLTERAEEFSVTRRLWTAYAVVDAVAYASGQRGVAHHDLKPQNILFQRTPAGSWDVPKVVDWGLSRELIQHTGSISQASPEYAAPEQFDAFMSETAVGPHTDVYQLGVVCYELLTGDRPDHLRGTPTPPSEADSEIPAVIDSVIMDALAHERTARIKHPLLLRDALEDILQGIVPNASRTETDGQQTTAETQKTVSHRTRETGRETDQTEETTVRADADSLSRRIEHTDATGEDVSPDADTGWFPSDHRRGTPPLSTAIRSVRTESTDGPVAQAIARHRPDSIGTAVESIDRSSNQ